MAKKDLHNPRPISGPEQPKHALRIANAQNPAAYGERIPSGDGSGIVSKPGLPVGRTKHKQ